jgi:hypothetical protein
VLYCVMICTYLSIAILHPLESRCLGHEQTLAPAMLFKLSLQVPLALAVFIMAWTRSKNPNNGPVTVVTALCQWHAAHWLRRGPN